MLEPVRSTWVAASIAFGLLFAMVGTLFVIPLSYTTLASAQRRGGRWWARLRGLGARRPLGEAP
ncbi:MAG: hypothetical protein VX681_00465 [Myxococcota bacterium]|nr:hypothetical protein [Myxococcota bacterium]